MGVGGKAVTIGYRYYMAIHMGLCRGPIDAIKTITVGDRVAFTAEPGIVETSGTQINAPDLFGGDKKEGGIQGFFVLMMGDRDQAGALDQHKNAMGGAVPSFRGVTTAIFDGLICAMNPYPKKWKFRTRRAYRGWDGPVWYPETVVIPLENGEIRAMNPAHILYECATNRDWGRGFPRSRLDDAAWRRAASTLFQEGFGLCLRWNRQDSLQSFVQIVLDHIGGSIFTDRETGLLTLRLMRDDYVAADLPLFDYNTGLLSVEEGETAALSSAVNEVVVKYHSPILDEDREVRAQNLASIQSLGALNSTSTDYSGIPTHDLAARVAQRDLRINTGSNRRFKIKLDRRAWRIYPGAPFRISAPDKGIGSLILRAGKITDGSLTSGEITVDAVIDVFGLTSSAFVAQQDSEWVPPDTTPVIPFNQKVREETYRDLFVRTSPADLALVDARSGSIATIAAKPTSLSLNYGIATRTGQDTFVQRTTESFAPTLTLTGDASAYASIVGFGPTSDAGLIAVGDILQIDDEIVRLDAIAVYDDGSGGVMTISRGCFDTIPARHVAGAVAFDIMDAVGTDGREYATGEIVETKLLTITPDAVLDQAIAPTQSTTIRGRQGRPYPPAAVRINGDPFLNVVSVQGDLEVTWAHRDRKLQQDQVVSHFEPSIGPEPDVTYTLRIYNAVNGPLLETYSGITGTRVTVARSITGSLRLELEAIRDGLASLYSYSRVVVRT